MTAAIMPNRVRSAVRPRHSRGRLIVLVSILIGLTLVASNLRAIEDWWILRDYVAPANVSQLATEDTMTPKARHIFYVNKPRIQSKAEFTRCTNTNEQTIVLGCYHGGQSGIYVLAVSDARLDGVEQVTAAHEMLHAAYDRLSTKERANVDRMLQSYYDNQLRDQRVKETIDAYRQLEPTELVNEMHSIFGTEVGELPPALETYYRHYFTDRSTVVAYAAQYQGEFTTRQATIKNDDAQLATLRKQIDGLQADLEARKTTLANQSAQLQALRASNNIAAYNAGVPGYNQGVNTYNDEVAQLKSLIAQYNELVAARNAVAQETQQLTNEINSKVAPINQ